MPVHTALLAAPKLSVHGSGVVLDDRPPSILGLPCLPSPSSDLVLAAALAQIARYAGMVWLVLAGQVQLTLRLMCSQRSALAN